MRKSIILAALAGCAFALTAGSAAACGESLFRIGKGVNFREYTAPLPGNIVVVANTEAELAMVARLAAAGHDMHIVSSPDLIGEELQKHDFDIVLAYFGQRAMVESQISGSSVAFLPVALEGTEEEDLARLQYERSLSSEDSVKHFLKTIHKTLKTHS